MPHSVSQRAIPSSFTVKKTQILSLLTRPEASYTDNSPKGTVDAQIRELIDEINAYDGLVTTSSCAGRVAVFVEGPKAKVLDKPSQRPEEDSREGEAGDDIRKRQDLTGSDGTATEPSPVAATAAATLTSPGGKGGGRWLYVSHDPIPMPLGSDGARSKASEQHKHDREPFSKLFNLASPSQPIRPSSTGPTAPATSSTPPRMIHLSFSPLILHIHCATLQHARPLLAAAINAGFRESGVPSLRALEDAEHGVMVAVRTAGLAFETVVGVVEDGIIDDGVDGANGIQRRGREVTKRVVDEEYLAMCAGVVNERFRWNAERRERFRGELRRAMRREGFSAPCGDGNGGGDVLGSEGRKTGQDAWEDRDERRRRKRDEGLERQRRERIAGARRGDDGNDEDQAEADEKGGGQDDLDDGFTALGCD